MNKKRFISLSILLLALASNTAYAWWFFYLPGSVTGAIGDALTGSEGANCVGSTAKVGDTLRLADGSRVIVKSLSGTSSRCTNPALPIRALLVPANESTPSGSTASNPNAYMPTNAGVDLPNESIGSGSITFDSYAGIELPEGWEHKTVSANMKAKGYFFYAVNRAIDAGLVVSAAKRQGIADVMEYARSGRSSQKSSLVNAKESDIEQLQINEMPAWRFEVTGNDWTGKSFTYLVTYVDVGTEVVAVRTFSPALDFRAQRAALSSLAYGLKTPPAPVAATPQAPMATTTREDPEPQGSIATRLGLLNKLYKDGLITEKDFESKKQEILRGL